MRATKTRHGFGAAVASFVAYDVLTSASAQEMDSTRFSAYLAGPTHAALVDRAVAKLPPEIFVRCPALESPSSKVKVLAPVSFGSDGLPASGQWLLRLPVKGCGADTSINLLFLAPGQRDKIDVVALVPGTTNASPLLQHDTMRYAFIGFGSRVKDCSSALVVDTRFERFGLAGPPTAEADQPWRETWTVKGCGRTVDVPIEFVPDATGTQIILLTEDISER